jgi:hypothetical protein
VTAIAGKRILVGGRFAVSGDESGRRTTSLRPRASFLALTTALLAASCSQGVRLVGEDGDAVDAVEVDSGSDDTTPDAMDAPCSTPGIPAPLHPANGAMTGSIHAPSSFSVLRPEFRWRAQRPDACDVRPVFELQVDDSCSTPGFGGCEFGSPEAAALGLADLSWQVPSDLPVSTTPPVGRRYYWRVRACCGTCCSAWSAVRYMDVGRVAGDLNGDGWSDAVVGALHNPSWPGDTGTVHIYYGGPAFGDAANVVLVGRHTSSFVGMSVASVGDVNADGYGDLVVADHDALRGEAALLYLGGPMIREEPDVALSVGTGYGHWSPAGAGDLNGDGFADVVVGVPFDRAGGSWTGRVLVYLGGEPPDETPDLDLSGTTTDDEFGWRAAGVGDVNGDGFADLGIASARWIGAGLFLGADPLDGTRDADFQIEDWRGSSINAIGGAGDLNGDGFADVALGVPRDASGTTESGLLHLYLGGTSIDGAPNATLIGDEVGDGFGYAVASAGDVDGDGLADLVVGAPFADRSASSWSAGHVYVYLGRTRPSTSPDAVVIGREGEALGAAVAGGGDVNGDGYSDWIAAAPQATDTGSVDRPPGHVYVMLGGTELATDPGFVLSADSGEDIFGFSVAFGRQPP